MYQIVIAWNDQTSKSEHIDNIISALEALAIYMRDPDCERANIYDCVKNELIFKWCRR